LKEKIKILRIINRFNLGGPTFNAAYLTKYIGDEFETLLIGGEKDETEESSTFILDSLHLTPTIISEMKREIGFKEDKIAYKKLKDIIKEFQPDIVHTHASKAGTLGRMAAYKCKVPVIVHTFHGHVFHSYFGKTKTVFYKNIERYLAKKSTKIIAISDIQKKELTRQYRICNKNKVAVVPLGFDLSRFQEDYESKRNDFRQHYLLEDDEITIGIIGRLVPIKNHTLFLEAIDQLLKKTTKKVRVFIIGDGEEKENLTQYCKELHLDFTEFNQQKKKATITFTSWIKNVDWVNSGLDIIALSSLNEGTPVSLIEAQAANNPIVTTNVGGVENVVLKDKTGLIVSSGDKQAFSEALLKLVENDALRKQMSEKGWEFVKEKFHYERLVNDMRELYFSLLENNKK
jgi:glycosyltransferase involved in cell wall biosynthesis